MINYFDNKTDAVQFVNDLKQTFPESSPSITTIIREKSEAYAVTFATVGSSGDTDLELVAKDFFKTQVNI